MTRAVSPIVWLFCVCAWLPACGTSGGEASADAGPEVDAEIAADAAEVAPDAADTTEPFVFPLRTLPFAFTRPADGQPIPAAEVRAFTAAVTGLLKDVGFARWLLRTSTGVDTSTGADDYLAWHNDIRAVKAGDTVTFRHVGGEHNMWIPGSKILAQVIGAYLLTYDWEWGKLTEQYCKGLSAVVKGFVWDLDDPAPYLMARAVFPMDHAFALDADTWHDDGRKKAVEFSAMYHDEDGWNAHTFAWPHNPTWGAMYVTNMRSKDDVCAITRTTTWLPYVVADAPDAHVREACAETWELMQGFHKDIVDSGYYIRTKDPDGTARLVTEQDLGNYVQYTPLGETNECTARLATDLIAYGERRTNDCGDGWGTVYERFAVQTHYYNYPIVWDYHLAALGNALARGHADLALPLLEGFATRMDDYLAPDSRQPGASHSEWGRDMAVLLVKAASMGLPLTAREARHVQQYWLAAVAELRAFPNWDLWDASVPEGEYGNGGGVRPRVSPAGVDVEGFGMFLEYCASPFQNPAGAAFIDCEIVADMARWGAAE